MKFCNSHLTCNIFNLHMRRFFFGLVYITHPFTLNQKILQEQADLGLCFLICLHIIWAATCDFQQCGDLTSVDSDEPVQPPFKLRNSKWCSVSSSIFIEYSATSKGSDQTALSAGWSKALLVAHTTLLEISCCCSYVSRANIISDLPRDEESKFLDQNSLYFFWISW